MHDWSKKRKRLTMLVTVTVPENMNPSYARREVRELISNGAGFYTYAGEAIRCVGAKPGPRS